MDKALDLQFPALLLCLAMRVHSAPRFLMAEGQVSDPMFPKRGLLQGCPTSVALAKAYLFELLQTVAKRFPEVDFSSFIDDLGFDLCGDDPDELATAIMQIFFVVQNGLASLGLEINLAKSGFLCSSPAVKRSLVKLHEHLPRILPKPCDVIRDLGIDNIAGRLRRLRTFKKRMSRALRRAGKLRQLPKRIRATLVQTNVLPSGLWGSQGNGIAPSTLRSFRTQVASKAGFRHKLGCGTIAWRLAEDPFKDPSHRTLTQQVCGFMDIVKHFSPSLLTLTQNSWKLAKDRIWSKMRHWHYARGPLTSLLCTLKDLNWDAAEMHVWFNPQGDEVRIDVGNPLSIFHLLARLHDDHEAGFWREVSRHQGGSGLEYGGDLVVGNKFLRQVQDRPEEYRAAMSVLQGSLPSSHNRCLASCPFCPAEPTLRHLLYDCPVLNAELSTAPADWSLHLDDPTQQCYWLRGIAPSQWTHLKASVRTDLLGHVEVGGLWANVDVLDGLHFYFGVDASGGSRSHDPRTRLCSWGIAAVALDATGRWQCIAWKSGLLPGNTQSVPRAELYAIVVLSRHTSGAISFSSDSQLNMKTFRRLVHGRQLKSNCANLDLWLELQQVLSSRWLRGTWVRSHLTQAQFEEQFGSENLWAFASNASADEAAGKFSAWLDGQHILSTWVDIRRWTDKRTLQVLQYLTTRAMRVLRAPKEPKAQGPKRVTRLEFLEGLPLTHSHHCWRLGFSRLFSSCLLCGLRVSDVTSGRRLAGFSCFRTTQDWLEHGVHYTHELDFRGPGGGWRCRGCKLCIRPHSGQSAWTRLARGCTGHKLRVR